MAQKAEKAQATGKQKQKKERQARGRPSYKPSDKDRNQVETMVGLGLTADDVCNVMGFSRATLFKYFRDELAVGYSVAKTNVTQKAFEMGCPNLPNLKQNPSPDLEVSIAMLPCVPRSSQCPPGRTCNPKAVSNVRGRRQRA